MAKATDAPPGPDEETDVESTDAPVPAKETRTRVVIANPLLKASNDICRILAELDPFERKSVMQIVNILVDTPFKVPPTESE